MWNFCFHFFRQNPVYSFHIMPPLYLSCTAAFIIYRKVLFIITKRTIAPLINLLKVKRMSVLQNPFQDNSCSLTKPQDDSGGKCPGLVTKFSVGGRKQRLGPKGLFERGALFLLQGTFQSDCQATQVSVCLYDLVSRYMKWIIIILDQRFREKWWCLNILRNLLQFQCDLQQFLSP